MNVNDSERNGRCSSLTYIESRVSIGCVFCFGLEFCIGKFVVFHSESKAEGTKSTTIIFVFCWIFIFFCCSDDYITKLVGLISQNSGVLFFICLKSSAVTSACCFFLFFGSHQDFSIHEIVFAYFGGRAVFELNRVECVVLSLLTLAQSAQ